jgi:phenylacetate-CoA ligase
MIGPETCKLLYKSWRMGHNFSRSREDILKLREERFRKLLKYAYQHSPFYRDYYSSHGIHEEDLSEMPFADLPPIDKKEYIENFDRLTTREELTRSRIENFLQTTADREAKFLGEYTLVHSSGTTGTPTYFVYDRLAWDTVLAAGFRACEGEESVFRLIQGLFGGIRVAYIAATAGRFGGVMVANAGIKGYGFKRLIFNINNPLDSWVDRIQDFNPNVIIGYPSGVKILCDLLNKGKLSLSVFRLITGGEPLTAQLRDYLETTLETEVFNLYGASESIIIGLGRKKYGGIYLFDDINYVEPEEKCVYITPLYNYAQPLIRYRLSDKLKVAARSDNELLPFSKIEKVIGRNEDIIWFKNKDGVEDFIHPLVIDDIEVKGMKKYQFIQKSLSEFIINVNLDEGIELAEVEGEIRSQVDRILREKNLDNLDYRICKVSELPVNPSTGKSPLVVKQVGN